MEQELEQPQTPRRFYTSKKIWGPLAGLVIIALTAIGYVLFQNRSTPDQHQTNSAKGNTQEPKEDTSTIQMLATGDFIAHDAINAEAKQEDGTYNYAPMTAGFKEDFSAADINFCNLATLAGGEQFGVTGYPIFNAPLEWNRDMHALGCNLINTGTNHTNDKGQAAITAELDDWEKKDKVLAIAGANRSSEEQNKVRYFEVKGVKFAFLSYSTYSNSPNPNPYSLNRFTEPLVTTQLTEARAASDIVIVSMRWGTEYSETINVAQERDAKKLADLGADIVLGHGTHTLQPVKKLTGKDGRETTVWFGLGNFLNAQLETTGLTGCVAGFDIDTATKKVKSTHCLPFYQHYEWSAADKAAGRLLNRSKFQIMPLHHADEFITKSQLGTTVEEQMTRIEKLVNTYTEIAVKDTD